MRRRVREQLLQGASQIKLVGSGGVSSPRSPLEAKVHHSEPELRAAVEATRDWATYVTVHAYSPPGPIQRAIAAGAGCVEHGHLMDEATARLMADKGVWLSIQPFVGDDDSICLTGQSRIDQLQVIAGTDRAYRLAKAHGIKTAFGSDLLFSAELTCRQGVMLTHLTSWYPTAEVLTVATAANGELLALSGPRNPYPGKLGVVEEGVVNAGEKLHRLAGVKIHHRLRWAPPKQEQTTSAFRFDQEPAFPSRPGITLARRAA